MLVQQVDEDHTTRHHNPERRRTVYEFCCSKNSELGKVAANNGIQCVRLCKEHTDMYNSEHITSLCKLIDDTPGCHLHASIPCTVWSTWQHVDCAKKGDWYRAELAMKQRKSLKLFENFVRAATAV